MDETQPSQITFYNWTDYIDPGIKKDFQKKTGISVKEVYFQSNEEMLAKLRAGAKGYDVIVPSDYMVHIMIKSKLLEPLDVKYVPNYTSIDAQFDGPGLRQARPERRHAVQRALLLRDDGLRTAHQATR